MQAIHIENGKFYFWDETWADRMGPYDNEYDACIGYIKYANALEGLALLMELQHVKEEKGRRAEG